MKYILAAFLLWFVYRREAFAPPSEMTPHQAERLAAEWLESINE